MWESRQEISITSSLSYPSRAIFNRADLLRFVPALALAGTGASRGIARKRVVPRRGFVSYPDRNGSDTEILRLSCCVSFPVTPQVSRRKQRSQAQEGGAATLSICLGHKLGRSLSNPWIRFVELILSYSSRASRALVSLVSTDGDDMAS